MPGTTSISGVVSGLKTDDIITKLMELEKAPITRLKTQQVILKTKLAAWQDANTRMLALKIKTDALTKGETFNQTSFASNNESIVTGSVDSTASPGTYFLRVTALAQTHQVSTQGYEDTTATAVGTGTIKIKTGTGEEKTINIDSSNNNLAGLRDAINRSESGVTATIINDGNGSTPYRLLLTSNSSGSAGHITLTSDLTGGTAPVISTIQADQDASIQLGEGASAITVTKSSNKVTDLIPGVTLNLKVADPEKVVTITCTRDIERAKTVIRDFVEQYNNLMIFMNNQFSFDADTNTSGTLFNDSSLMTMQSSLRSMVSNPLTGTSQTIKLMSQIGITSTTSDTLSINESDLDKALSENMDQVMRLFASTGEATHTAVEYVSSTSKTKASSLDGYAVKITTAATQTRVTTGVAQSDVLGSNETLTINGITVNLTAGMTQSQVIAQINDVSGKTGIKVAATDTSGSGTGNYLTFTCMNFGSAQIISIASNVSNGGTSPLVNTSGIGNVTATQSTPAGEAGTGTGAAGVDIAGTINGEPATGKGLVLTGNSDNENTADLKIRVTGTVPGDYGVIKFTKGAGSVFSEYISAMVEESTGVVIDAQEFIQSQIDYITDDIASMEARATAKQERLAAQFAAMEGALSRLQSQGDYLSTQFAAASNNNKK